MRLNILIASLLIILINQSCTDNIGMASGGGREGEVVVVLNEEFQEGEAGKIIDQYLRGPYLILPQYEPLFKLYVISWYSFSETFKAYRNIVKVDIGSKYQESKALLQQNKNQTVVTLTAPTVHDFVELFEKHGTQIVNALSKSEREFAKRQIKKGDEVNLQKYLKNKHHVDMIIPQGYSIRKDTTDFVYLALETNELTLGIMIYYYPYIDKKAFTIDNLLSKRDSICKKHIKGPLYPEKMSYMTTSRDPFTPLLKESMIDNMYVAEIRGLWNVTDDFMGGPFLSTSRVDEERNRVVTVEGFVYYPSENKRKFMRWFEVITESVTFPKKETTQ
ncbi:MAG: DUF4837 family protein [Salinivirgaceae bacterium]|jgi:hypothetical protein|nr:DUF4837 family protein [Bacteroidales bacterium]